MSTTRRTIVLSVQDDFSRQLREFARQMDAAGDATTRLSQVAGGQRGGFGAMAFNLNQMFGAAQQVYGVFQQIYSTVDAWAEIGVGAQRSQMALAKLAGSAQEAERWINAITTATRGTVTEGEAAAQAYQLMRFGLADSAEAAGQFVHDMSIIAAINPQLGSTAEAINQIQLTLSNQSFMRLDQLGISAGEVRKRIKELRDETEGLTQEEAFQIAVMEELSEQAATVGDDILTLTSNQDLLAAKFRAFKEDAGAVFNAALEDVSGSLLDIIDYISTLANMSAIDIVIKVSADLTDVPEIIVRDLLGIDTEKQTVNRGWSDAEINFAPDDPYWKGVGESAGSSFGEGFATSLDGMDMTWLINAMNPNGNFFLPGLEEYITRGETAILSQTLGSGFGEFVTMPEVQAMFDYYASQRRDDFVGRAPFAAFTPGSRFIPGMQGDLPGSIPGGIFHPSPAEQGDFANRRAGMGLQFMLPDFAFQASQNADAGMMAVQSAFGGLPEIIQNANIALGDTLSTVTQIGEEGTVIVTQWDSLNKKFGVSPEAFDADVYSRATNALRDAGVEADAYERAMMALGLATGVTTTQNELFNARLDVLSSDMAEGKITVEEWVDEVSKLGQTDLSWVDEATAGMDFSEIEDFISTLAETDLEDGEVMDTFQPLVDSAVTATEDIQTALDESSQNWITPVGEFVAKGGEEFGTLRESVAGELAHIETLMQSVFGGTYTFTVTGSGSGGIGPAPAPGGGSLPGLQGFDVGGPVGPAGGMVHDGEYVVPRGGALVMSGGAPQTVRVPVFLDGRLITEVVADVNDRQEGS